MRLHHAAVCSSNIDSSLAFWRDGLGLEVLMDHSFTGDWPTLFGVASSTLRSVFLGEPGADDAGVVELVDFGRPAPTVPLPPAPIGGFFLLSFYVDLAATLDRLHSVGVVDEARRITVQGVGMAVVVSPEDIRVELIDLAPAVP